MLKEDFTVWCWGINGSYGRLGIGENTTSDMRTPVQVKGVDGVGFLENVSQISAGTDHTCATKTDGTAYCWGYNTYGRLGDNTTIDRYTPVQVLGVNASGFLENVSQISVGSAHTCATKTDGTAYCWGSNSSGRLGDNTTTSKYTPVQIKNAGATFLEPLSQSQKVSAGGLPYNSQESSSCTVREDSTVWCWGDNQYGQLGDGSTEMRQGAVQVKGVGGVGYLSDIVEITRGSYHTCATKTDGTAYCWGRNDYGRLGDNTQTQRLTPVQVKGVGNVGFLENVAQISAGNQHTCSLKTDGTAYCWGYNQSGQLGDNTTTSRYTPIQVKGVDGVGFLENVSWISLGESHTCAMKTDGTAYCWGSNSSGQLGDNTTTSKSTPVQVLGVGGSGNLSGVSLISSGYRHACATKTDGTAYCWGYNQSGQLGDNTTTSRYTPIQVLGVGGSGFFSGASQISTGSSHTCATKTDGTAYCWGSNGNGRLGDNTTTQRLAPVQVVGVGGSGYLEGILQISVGSSHTCVIKNTGKTLCWGYNSSGQLGADTGDMSTPVEVRTYLPFEGFLEGVSQISATSEHTCATKTDGTLYCWGSGRSGRLGNNTTIDRYTPLQVLGVEGSGFLEGVEDISTGNWHTCATKTDGTAYCWGLNSSGRLGDNTLIDRYTPIQVLGVGGSGFFSGISHISAGGSHTCALKTDGTTYCWGSNSSGQLSDNTYTNRSTP
ncbi:MAG: RCC1 repeat-containing protein, partial [Candidatus Moranbacteria bacterium]|nr:RCC1 repeat-containing protein [Candidatus Moranbacteria bacterium]